jgi:hypothetical protein
MTLPGRASYSITDERWVNFVVDSGATNSIVKDPKLLSDVEPCDIKVYGVGSRHTVSFKGTFHGTLVGTDGELFDFVLYDCWLAPEFRENLMSVAHLSPQGIWTQMSDAGGEIFDSFGRTVALEKNNGVYHLRTLLPNGRECGGSAFYGGRRDVRVKEEPVETGVPLGEARQDAHRNEEEAQRRKIAEWHEKLGHPGRKAMQEMASHNIIPFSDTEEAAETAHLTCGETGARMGEPLQDKLFSITTEGAEATAGAPHGALKQLSTTASGKTSVEQQLTATQVTTITQQQDFTALSNGVEGGGEAARSKALQEQEAASGQMQRS